MRFPSSFILAFSAFACLVSSQATSVASSQPTLTSTNGNQNPISNPLGGTLEAGSPITITWNLTYGNSVDLVLRKGKETDLDKVETIASSIPNSGAFVWAIPQDLVAGSDYSIQIISGAESNYSPQFGIDSLVTSSSTSSSSSSSSSTSTSSSSFSSSTKISTSATVTVTASTSSLTSPSAITIGAGTSNSSSATMRTSTSSPTITGTTAPNSDQATSINAGVHLASPLVLVWCLFSCLVYLG